MGTSIHLHIEVKKDGIWHHYSAPAIFRDYTFFSILTDVGCKARITPIALARGIPDDISFVTRHCYQQDQDCYFPLHHQSWLNREEIEELQTRINNAYKNSRVSTSEYDLEMHYFHTYINGNAVSAHEGWDDVRIIFWFDN